MMHLGEFPLSPDRGHGDAEVEERCRFLSDLASFSCSSVGNNMFSELYYKLQDIIPELFDGEILNKLQSIYQPGNKAALRQLAEFALYFLSNDKLDERRTGNFLKWAVKTGSVHIFKSFFRLKTPTVEAFSEKIVESVAIYGPASTLRLLIESGLDESLLAGISGGRYLQIAIYTDNIDVAHLLLDKGAEVNPPLLEFSPHNDTPLVIAILSDITKEGTDFGTDEYNDEYTDSIICLAFRLIELGAQVDDVSSTGPALLCAVSEGHGRVVGRLLQAGVKVDIEGSGNTNYLSPLDWAYMYDETIYRMLLPLSQIAKTCPTMSGILSAASQGSLSLFLYLEDRKQAGPRARRKKLEETLEYLVTKLPKSEMISVLLEFGVDPNFTSTTYSKPLIFTAVKYRDVDLVLRLLDSGANINRLDFFPDLPLYEPIGSEILAILIEQGLDVIKYGHMALQMAIRCDNFSAIRLLFQSGLSLNDAGLSVRGYTALSLATTAGCKLEIIKYLINKGAKINAPRSWGAVVTALQGAAAAGEFDLVKFLLNSGADINDESSIREGTTALEASLSYSRLHRSPFAIFQYLLDKGADINGPDRPRRCKKWNSALVSLILKRADSTIIQRALDSGADVNICGIGEEARTPLQAAAEIVDLALVKKLLELGANINAPPSECHGRTALQAASSGEEPSLELVGYLLKEGADVNSKAGIKGGLTALQGAAIRGHIKIASMLMEAGADVNAWPAKIDGRTALDGAAEHGRLDMVQLLLNCGAKSYDSGDLKFGNAIKLARNNGHFAIAKLLATQTDF